MHAIFKGNKDAFEDNNINKIQYVDKADNCFSYDYKKTQCPTDKSEIKEIPVQY